MKIDIEKLREIVKEEVHKHDRELNSKLQMYVGKLNKLMKERKEEYLSENKVVNEDERIGELRMLEKVTEDLNKILYEESE